MQNEKTAQAQRREAVPSINNTDLVNAFRAGGGRIIHFLPYRIGFGGRMTRGMTFAYERKNGRIEFATAVQHRNDTFSKKAGTKTAIEHFLAGKTVVFPVSTEKKSTEFFKDLTLFVRD